jgi:hypothetical protein
LPPPVTGLEVDGLPLAAGAGCPNAAALKINERKDRRIALTR